jgi:hypothetical protein
VQEALKAKPVNRMALNLMIVGELAQAIVDVNGGSLIKKRLDVHNGLLLSATCLLSGVKRTLPWARPHLALTREKKLKPGTRGRLFGVIGLEGGGLV